jgi:hypothetical protein
MEEDGKDQVDKSHEKLRRITESQEGNASPTYNKKKANWIGYNCCRNCLLKHLTVGKIEGRI